MAGLIRDFRYAARQLRRTPGFTAIAILTLALGIGASTAVFAVVNELIFRPLRVTHATNVYVVVGWGRPAMRANQTTAAPASRSQRSLTVSEFRAFQSQPGRPLIAVAAIGGGDITMQIPGKAQHVRAEGVAGRYQDVFRVTAQVGRLLDAGDDADALNHVVISERVWRSWFGADRSVIGRSLQVGPRSVTIVGVAPRGLGGANAADVWLPLSTFRALKIEQVANDPARAAEAAAYASRRDAFSGQVYVRAEPNAPPAAVGAALDPLYGPAVADASGSAGVLVMALSELRGGNRQLATGRMILGLAALVLLGACANLANLLYVRGAKRAGEVAVRLSLGGQPGDILRLFLAETAIIAGVASLTGLGLAAAGLRFIGVAATSLGGSRSTLRSGIEMDSGQVGTDLDVVLFAFGSAVVAVLIVGVVTAWRASRVPPLQTLAAAGVPAGITPRGRRWRVALVAVQVTAAVLLMMSTGMWVGRLADELHKSVRFDTAGITAARVDLTLHGFTPTRGRAFFEDALARARRIPGVDAAAMADGLPGHAYVSKGLFTISAEPLPTQTISTTRRVTAAYAGVSDGFLDALGVQLLRGRPLRPTDRYGAPLVAVVCESLAARLWPGEEPIGQRLMFGNDRQWRTVVGVSSDPIRSSKDTPYRCESCVAFVPWDQEYRSQMLIMVRSDRPAAMVEPLTAVIRAASQEVAIQEAAPLDDTLLAWVRPTRAAGTLMASLGALALLIASLGVYGVVSFLVSARTREFGIRMALGATPRGVIRLVLDHALHLMLVGLLPAVLIASLGTRLLQSQIRDLMPNDIPTWIAVPVLVLLVGLVAGYIPARRASKIDPTVALREL